MLFPGIFMALGILVVFFPHKMERLLVQKAALVLVLVNLFLVISIMGEAAAIGWVLDRAFLLIGSLWFIFCGILLALPILKLQRWIGQEAVFWLRSNLKIFALVQLVLAILAFILAL
ncbi:MAG: hypothetical protein ACRCVN_00920 [Spirochaetia bacterium]